MTDWNFKKILGIILIAVALNMITSYFIDWFRGIPVIIISIILFIIATKILKAKI